MWLWAGACILVVTSVRIPECFWKHTAVDFRCGTPCIAEHSGTLSFFLGNPYTASIDVYRMFIHRFLKKCHSSPHLYHLLSELVLQRSGKSVLDWRWVAPMKQRVIPTLHIRNMSQGAYSAFTQSYHNHSHPNPCLVFLCIYTLLSVMEPPVLNTFILLLL